MDDSLATVLLLIGFAMMISGGIAYTSEPRSEQENLRLRGFLSAVITLVTVIVTTLALALVRNFVVVALVAGVSAGLTLLTPKIVGVRATRWPLRRIGPALYIIGLVLFCLVAIITGATPF